MLRIGGTQVGLLVCEDGWNDHGADYATNPFERLRDASPDLVISINASPSHVGKREQRHQIFGGSSRRHGLPILYVNQIGGHDQVVYDGASFAAEPEAGIVFEAPRFVEDLRTLRFDNGRFLTAVDNNFPGNDARHPGQPDNTEMIIFSMDKKKVQAAPADHTATELQAHPAAPLHHIGIYAYRVAFLKQFPQLPQAPLEKAESLEQLRALWHGYPIAVHITPHAPGRGVDTPADLAAVRALFAEQQATAAS